MRHHTLTESGEIHHYSVVWNDGVVEEDIPAAEVKVTLQQEHSHKPKSKKKKKKAG